MLDKIAPGHSDALMLGFETSDDSAVYRLTDDMAALLTVDFFTPIVDDPYDFGRITAANALSDIYAMGGRPLTAMNLLAFPCSMGADIVGEVVRGGAEKVTEAGAVTVGGHTIDDKEPKFGLSVFGVVHPDKVVRNRGALVGDVLFLTKPIGTGLMGTALKNGLEDEDTARDVIESMAALEPRRVRGDGRRGSPRGNRRDRLRAPRPPARDGGGERLCGRARSDRSARVRARARLRVDRASCPAGPPTSSPGPMSSRPGRRQPTASCG